ncbi:phosphatidylglycerol:prolipoprotein diacylglycerol transferase [Inhella inkyongensis]|uniref:Phosphatidylglycerol--prolipoprotein diacylglyceryl transferase n=1 Tax=Inhella inkyongensis TaxID=392593 RepID=A0A840S8Y8_9BURK|nr:prolipoprotein diacylglyceryl transferase [Inhella inkyongensis]MBB5206082.1 phosphatidylglycerol:prolipoprotein diacylglycerol transferase [Inhella inkyongensis]
MWVHPQFDPVALRLGPLAIHWYGLMYLLAFGMFFFLMRRRMATPAGSGWAPTQLDDLLFYGVLGVVLGGRLGQVLFYEPLYYLNHPLEILQVWKGGMSFHGGLLGVIVAMALYARAQGRHFLDVTDFIAPGVPTGLMVGRIGNFINGELWGRAAPADLPWAMVFPQAGDWVARHPSQIYQSLTEGLLLFVLLAWYARHPRARGRVSAFFLMGYGGFRFFMEFFREPDHFDFGLSFISQGQTLCLLMVAAGAWLWWRAPAREAVR